MTWPRVRLEDVASIQGGIQKQPKRVPRLHAFPFLRVANVTANGLDLAEIHTIELFDGELERYRLHSGDLLVVEGNGSASQIGRAAVWDGSVPDSVHQNHLIRVRPGPNVDPRYLGLVWNSPLIRDELRAVSSSTSGLHTLSVAKLKRILLPLPSPAEQLRIVEILEDHLSRLDAAEGQLDQVRRRLAALRSASQEIAVAPGDEGWRRLSVGEITDGDKSGIIIGPFGSNLTTRDYRTEGTPLVFVRNVRARDFSLERKFVDDAKATELSSHRAVDGDVLITKMGDPPGDTAVYRGEPAIITADIIRLRPSREHDPDFVALALSAADARRQVLSITSGVAQKKVSLGRFRSSVSLIMPPHDFQRHRMRTHRATCEAIDRIDGVIVSSKDRSRALRRAVLAAAFSGKLTGRHTDQEVIEELAEVPSSCSETMVTA